MAVPPEQFGRPKSVNEHVIDVPTPGGQGAWIYELVRTTVWVDAGVPQRIPHRFRAWYRSRYNGPREGPL